MEILIYKLIDPRSNEIRYVGKTKKTLRKRLYEHLTKRNLIPKTHKNNWVKQLLNEGFKPIIEIVEVVNELNWKEREMYHIKKLKTDGIKLTNTTDGGDGALGTKQSEESIRKALKTRKDRYGDLAFKISDKQKECIRIAQIGRIKSNNEIEKQANHLRKTLFQCDLNGNIIKEWFGVRKCAKELNIDYYKLKYYIKSHKPLNGFIWKYQ